MTISVPKNKIKEFLSLSKKRDVESTVIGEFNNSGYFECKYNQELVCSIEMKMLHDGLPKMQLKAEWINPQEKRLDQLNKNYHIVVDTNEDRIIYRNTIVCQPACGEISICYLY